VSDMLVIEPVDPQGPAALSLLREAVLEARGLYPDLIAFDAPMPTNPPLQERSTYLVAVLTDTPVGCAALRPLDGVTAEVRRMYVLRSARTSGVASALLARLEQAATSLGYHSLRLQTGNRQQAAMALYEAAGFKRIEAFGEYTSDPTSVCYEKGLVPERGL
jgi:putative acetyltransferase